MRRITDRLHPWRFRKTVAAKASDLIAIHGALADGVAREQTRRERTTQ